MGNCFALFKARRDCYVSSEDLPNEMLWEILSYLDNKTKLDVGLVNWRLFQLVNAQIERLSIKTPKNTEDLEEIQKLIYRFPRIRSLELANRINYLSELVPLKSLALKDFSLEFDVHKNLIRSSPATHIRRVKLENSQDFDILTSSNPSQLVIHFEVLRPIRFETIMSLKRIERISMYEWSHKVIDLDRQFIEAILTRPNLKQIDFTFLFKSNVPKFSKKNFTVEEITFNCNSLNLELLKQLVDALPNTQRVRVVLFYPDLLNMIEFLKIISDLKNLKSLHFAMSGIKNSDVQKMQDCCNIVDEFPIQAKVVIADFAPWYSKELLKNIVVKEEGKPSQRIQISRFRSHSRYPLSGSSFLPQKM